MGRLTRRAEADGVKAVWYGKRDVFLEGEVGYAEADKLAHYEDLEEQGRLIEQKNGKWIKRHNKSSWTHFTYLCSVCDSGSDFDTAYCPNCGAKMEELEE